MTMQLQQVTANNQRVEQKHPGRPRPKPAIAARAHIHPGCSGQWQQALGNRAWGQFIQARLTINPPGDVYEQEADRVAEQVTSAGSTATGTSVQTTPVAVQRKCTECEGGSALSRISRDTCAEEEEKLRGKSIRLQRKAGEKPEDAETVQAKASRRVGTSHFAPSFTAVHPALAGLQGGGKSLPTAVRAFFEPRFGYDFSQVRVHTDAHAGASAQEINARAYTVGPNVVFAPGQFAPATLDGQRLIAHELTHVVQQGSAATVQKLTRPDRSRSPDDRFELEAQSLADRVMGGERVQVGQSLRNNSTLHVQRDLATPPPAVAPAALPDLTDAEIQAAIVFNRARYDATNTKLIQDLLGGPVTGVWEKANIEAIAATQEEYGLKKDGMVGFDTFRFLNSEARRERLSTTTPNCLTSFLLIGPDAATFVRNSPTQCTFRGHFRTQSQFSERCNCSQFEYRQFIRGHFRRERGGVVTDLGGSFASLPAGRLNAGFQEDGDTTDPVVNYGHRADPVDAQVENHYLDNRRADDQANGCRYRNEDFPGGPIPDCNPGDIYDIDVSFRGEIQRNGTPVERKFWSAIRNRFVAPP